MSQFDVLSIETTGAAPEATLSPWIEQHEPAIERHEWFDSVCVCLIDLSTFADQYGGRGQTTIRRVITSLCTFDTVKRVSHVQTNDTTETGIGELFKCQDGEVELVETVSGERGCGGRDVQEQLRNTYGFTAYMADDIFSM